MSESDSLGVYAEALTAKKWNQNEECGISATANKVCRKEVYDEFKLANVYNNSRKCPISGEECI